MYLKYFKNLDLSEIKRLEAERDNLKVEYNKSFDKLYDCISNLMDVEEAKKITDQLNSIRANAEDYNRLVKENNDLKNQKTESDKNIKEFLNIIFKLLEESNAMFNNERTES